MQTTAVLLEKPESLSLARLDLTPPGDGDVVVDVEWSGISTGTERLLYSGRMPHFPGMGYPLVPGYESVGRVVEAGSETGLGLDQAVFVPGARCFGEVRGLFGAAASRLVTAADRVIPLPDSLGESGILLALAATAHHALAAPDAIAPDLIIGHGVLGRLLARVAMALGHPPPTVWERNPRRATGATGYAVIAPDGDARRDYRCIYDVSGDAGLLNDLIGRLAPGGTVVLAGFYETDIGFAFPPAFMREARIRIAAEWKPADIAAVRTLIDDGRLLLDGLITHREAAKNAPSAYRTAFEDSACLKMTLDWRSCS